MVLCIWSDIDDRISNAYLLFCRTTMTITRTLWPAPAPWLACTQVTRCRSTCILSPVSTTSQETASLSSQDASWKPLIFSVPTFLSAFFSVKVERTVVANFVMRQMTKEVFESQSLFFLKKDHYICQSVFLSDSLKNMWSTDLRAVFDSTWKITCSNFDKIDTHDKYN